jgi:hypothetical protein
MRPIASVLTTASDRLKETFSDWIASDSTQFPDVVNSDTATWHTDEVYSNGAAGLLAGNKMTKTAFLLKPYYFPGARHAHSTVFLVGEPLMSDLGSERMNHF